MGRDGAWIKVVMFILGVIMVAGITRVLLDPGLGAVDESRRLKHPAGFSMVVPRGWSGTAVNGQNIDTIRFMPERATGRQPSMIITRYENAPPAPDDAAKPGLFQGEPAMVLRKRIKYDWVWDARFDRGGKTYSIRYLTPIDEDIERSPMMPFINSFHAETPATTPATIPATMPTEPAP